MADLEKHVNTSQKICELCNDKSSKYCCPRCNVLYCSLDCYKSEKHSDCSEEFYRNCISEELASYQPDDASKNKMIDILKKMQAEGSGDIEDLHDDIEEVDNDSDDEEAIDLHERLKDLNLNDADAIWDVLTEDEKNEFQAIVNQGDVGSILPSWDAWWMYRKDKKLVEDVNGDAKEKEMLMACPDLKKVPEIKSLTTVEPSKAIKYNIVNIIASYTFIMRYFNGEIDPVEWVVYFLNICDNLDGNTNYHEMSIAVESVSQKCLQSELIETDKDSIQVMKHDTFLILQGPSEDNKKHYCKSMLSHLHRIMTDAKNNLKNNPKCTERKNMNKTAFSNKYPDHTGDLFILDVGKVKKCVKKIEFYLSYIESYNMDIEL